MSVKLNKEIKEDKGTKEKGKRRKTKEESQEVIKVRRVETKIKG